MNKRELKVRSEISGILSDKSPTERNNFIRDMEAFLYTENRRIRDLEIEASLKEKNQHVYSVRVFR